MNINIEKISMYNWGMKIDQILMAGAGRDRKNRDLKGREAKNTCSVIGHSSSPFW